MGHFSSSIPRLAMAHRRAKRLQLEKDGSGNQLCRIAALPVNLNGAINFAPGASTPSYSGVTIADCAFVFAGAGYIDCGAQAYGANDLTMTCCFTTGADIVTSRGICGHPYAGAGISRIDLVLFDSKININLNIGALGTVQLSAACAINTRYFVAVTLDRVNHQLKLYINGAPVGTATNATAIPAAGDFTPVNNFIIGRRAVTDYLIGSVHAAYVKLRALNQAEIDDLSNYLGC